MPDQQPTNPYEAPQVIDDAIARQTGLSKFDRLRNPAFDQTAFPRAIQFAGKIVPQHYAQLSHNIAPQKRSVNVRNAAIAIGAIALNLFILIKFFPSDRLLAILLIASVAYLVFLLLSTSFGLTLVYAAIPVKGEIGRGGVTMRQRNKHGRGLSDETSFFPWDILFVTEQLPEGGADLQPAPIDSSLRPNPIRLILYIKYHPSDSVAGSYHAKSKTPFFDMIYFEASLFSDPNDWQTLVEFLRAHLAAKPEGLN